MFDLLPLRRRVGLCHHWSCYHTDTEGCSAPFRVRIGSLQTEEICQCNSNDNAGNYDGWNVVIGSRLSAGKDVRRHRT